MQSLKDKLSNLFQISDDFPNCSALLKDREISGKLDQKKINEIIKIICDHIEVAGK